MKRFIKKAWPVAAGLTIAAVIIALYMGFFYGMSSPESAVEGYIKASMLYDTDGIIKYASDYTKAELYGFKDFTDGALRAKLEAAYGQAESPYKGKDIVFSADKVEQIDTESEEYRIILDEYEYMTRSRDISGAAKVTFSVYADGVKVQERAVYAIKSGNKWYYGY